MENKYKKFYKDIKKAVNEPTVDYCNGCTCRVPCGSNEREIFLRVEKIIEDFDRA